MSLLLVLLQPLFASDIKQMASIFHTYEKCQPSVLYAFDKPCQFYFRKLQYRL